MDWLNIDERVAKLFLEYNIDLNYINTKNQRELNRIYRIAKIIESNLGAKQFAKLEPKIRSFVDKIEFLFKNKYILPYKPKYSPHLRDYNIDLEDDSAVLDYIANEARRLMLIDMQYDEEYELSAVPTVNQCRNASLNVSFICRNLGIRYEVVKLSPGYSNELHLFNGTGYHYLSFVYLNSKRYLVDVTYSQFFTSRNNSLDRLGVCNTLNCLPGRYMLMTKKRILIAKKILRDGWIELTDDVLKNYFDGFTLFYRNGLYYEQNPNATFVTPYSVDDYKRFLLGADNQINHEGEENLGYQKRPLQNPYLDFKKKR